MIEFDEGELLGVAKAVIRFNPYCKDMDPTQLVNMMRDIAQRRPGYVSTYGFVLTTFEYGHQLAVKAAVSHTILED